MGLRFRVYGLGRFWGRCGGEGSKHALLGHAPEPHAAGAVDVCRCDLGGNLFLDLPLPLLVTLHAAAHAIVLPARGPGDVKRHPVDGLLVLPLGLVDLLPLPRPLRPLRLLRLLPLGLGARSFLLLPLPGEAVLLVLLRGLPVHQDGDSPGALPGHGLDHRVPLLVLLAGQGGGDEHRKHLLREVLPESPLVLVPGGPKF
mmetsp:Transcript_20806/g.65862  ORF Transcript_20806/g.65862 Transcript_20806/m.65862 type:complete len:200 (-) Transcript_20806:685-1284(-)